MHSSPRNLAGAVLVGLFLLQVPARAADTVSVVLIDGAMRADWPDSGVVGFRREQTSGNLTVNFSVGGSAISGTEFSGPSGTSVVIPDGQREAWVEFMPIGAALLPSAKTIVVTALPGSGYSVAQNPLLQSATISLSPASATPGEKAAIRFLLQAAFGPDSKFVNVKEVQKLGYAGWLEAQFKKPVGLIQPFLNRLSAAKRGRIYADSKAMAWWGQVMKSGATADPLRQRVGFALSEIFVISDAADTLGNTPLGMANYYDMLLKKSFGNFRDILSSVGMHPAMGIYLNALQNQKGDPVEGTFADENYAREVMQLFSIGLWELNPDGTRKLDSNGKPIPTYDNTTIANMARVMTGFSWGGPKAKDFWDAPENYFVPMRMWDEYHDVGAKTIIGQISLPARTASASPDTGAAGLADYNAAIDALFNHPNCAPFISKQLIQKLVTSNPSPAYVARVSAVFANNGQGVRGDMKAVVRAILLDSEARDPAKISDTVFGKMKENYLRTVNLVRALNARAANGVYALSYLDDIHYQQPMSAPSVFNFFKPGYAPSGPINDAGLVAPEFQILNSVTAFAIPSYHYDSLWNGFNRWGSDKRGTLVLPDLRTELALATDVPALMRRLDLLLTGGTLPREQHEVIRTAVESINDQMWRYKEQRVRMAISLIAGTPEFAILH